MIWLKLLVLICLQGWSLSDITKNLRHFEILSASDLSHSIVKRGLADSNHQYNKIKEVGFKALGREFRLLLSPKTGLLHKKSFYQGRVFGELSSNAVVHFSEEGILTAKIQTSEDTYHVEPAWRFLVRCFIELECSPSSHSKNCQKKDDDEEDFVLLSRSKRHNEYMSLRQTRCPLLLVADYRFYKEMGGSSSKTTVNYLISLIDRVHKIYEDTIWKDTSGSSGFSGMGFIIKKILVHRKPTLVQDGQVHYNMEKSSWDVRNLLEVFSRDDSHKHFCLAHLFTDIKFEGGILGLAYVGSPRRNSVGGICTPEYFKNSHTLYLNSGLSSSRNHYGQRVITREADLVTAHEFGHNWGSEHDPDSSECSPSASQGGSYLMYTYSVSGYDINNKKFSPCSLRFIRKVLLAKSSRCFLSLKNHFVDQKIQMLVVMKTVNFVLWLNVRIKNSPCCESCNFVLRGAKCRAANLGTCEQESHCTGKKENAEKVNVYPIVKFKASNHVCVTPKKNACKRCCRERTNSSCYPALDQRGMEDQLPDGTPCYQGFCNKGICERTMQDVVERIWDFIEDFNINSVLKFLKDNVVGVVVFISLLFWIPCSCLISYVDRKRAEKDEEEWKWMTHNQLIHPRDNRRIVEISVPRSHTPCNGRRDLNRDHYHPSRNRLSAL
ncbi:ADAM17 [Lepeophtheirus salmonis]|uniref:ADAM17 n=1 Tax=Lepeophtheirus salmonis TaxID=72036 RepID=A0A7R8H8W4_LEPSM|nr:ADAM17 [Lepeophtheirus salmonis]CAF2938435.1 ADAM17 [Lepeophtheirus salmonis]